MKICFRNVPVFIVFCTIAGFGAITTFAQDSTAKLQKVLREKAAFEQTDFTALEHGHTVVKLSPSQDKKEISVCGLVSVQASGELFLQSYRDSMARKNSDAILEIGRFSSQPTIDDLKNLTIDDRDLADLQQCVIGSCKVKLSARMIERLQKEVDWQAPDHRLHATRLIKTMLVDYVRDYLARGEPALMRYSDKSAEVGIADEYRALMASSSYGNDALAELTQSMKSGSGREISIVENAIIWSKIKFGLKPVTAINHIVIYRRAHEAGPQVLIASKQIYANHYFNSSLSLTAYVNIPGANQSSYIFYENRSRVDGLSGPFGKFKRALVEDRTVDGLKGILENTKMSLDLRASNRVEFPQAQHNRRWKRWVVGGFRVFLVVIVISTFVGLVRLRSQIWRGGFSGGTHPGN